MEAGFGNQAILAKIDKLRELNVGSMIPLPQLVVVGDQSSGKSSVLENLTGFSFPRAAGLCTRYATQITCCRDAHPNVSISIIPRPDASEKLKEELLGFQRELRGLDNERLACIFEEVCWCAERTDAGSDSVRAIDRPTLPWESRWTTMSWRRAVGRSARTFSR